MRARQSILLLTTLLTLVSSSFSFAKIINLYEQPKTEAKVLGTLDSSAGMVPIFTPQNSEWMKVGDPKNGNVGWIQTKDLSDNNGSLSTALSVTQQTIKTSNGPKTIQSVKLATPQTMTPEQNDALTKQVQEHQAQVQQSIQKIMQIFYQQMNDYYEAHPALFTDPKNNLPVIMPIMVYPTQEKMKSTDATGSTQNSSKSK